MMGNSCMIILIFIQDVLRRRFGNALHWYQSLTATANHEVSTWIRNATFAASTAVPEIFPETGSMEGIMEGKTRPRGVTVEETEDEDLPHSSLHLQSKTNTTGSLDNCMATPRQSGDTQFHIANGRDPGESEKSQLGMPVSHSLPFPMPRDLPRINENTPSAVSPSVYLQGRCPVCFSGSKPNLSNSACVSGLESSDEHANPHPHQSPCHSLRGCQLCPAKAPFAPPRSSGSAP